MNTTPQPPRIPATVSAQASQDLTALQQALLENVRQFSSDVRRCAHDWQTRWNDATLTQGLEEIGNELGAALDGLAEEFRQARGPSLPRVDGFLTLLGLRNTTGLLPRLQRLADQRATPPTLDDQRLLSEVDTLFIQFNGLRAQWNDYLALASKAARGTAQQNAAPLLPPEPQPGHHVTVVLPPSDIDEPDDEEDLPPLPWVAPAPLAAPPPIRMPPPLTAPPPIRTPPPAPQRRGLLGDMDGLLNRLLWILLILVLIIVLVAGVVSRLSQSHAPIASAVSPTSVARPTTIPSPTVPPTPTFPPTTPAGLPQLRVSPATLVLPCPVTGAAPLQLANTGTSPLDWQISISSASSGNPGILLDGEQTESGHLNSGQSFQVSVTAQLRTAQGSLRVSYTDASAPITVPYSVHC